MPVNFALPSAAEYVRFLPEIVLTAAGTLAMVLEPLTGRRSKPLIGYSSLLGLVLALLAAVWANGVPGPAFSGMIVVDGFATFFRILAIVAGILVTLSSAQYLRVENAESGEFHALLLYSITGQCMMAAANDLIIVFIGLEISSIASYVLAGFLRRSKLANEASAKYFLLGSFATAFLLYGVALIYGTTGSTNLERIAEVLRGGVPAAAAQLPAGGPVLVAAAAALMFVGLAFKVSAAPFQIWAPDVYQGAPAPVTAFLAAGPKALAFAVLVRIFVFALGTQSSRWEPVIWISALATMIVGNFAALHQTNIKRLLAYSSIAHAGYVMVAVTAHSPGGAAAVMFYMAAYVFMNIGAFAVVTYVARKGERYVKIDDLAGLGQRQPTVAALFSVLLLSLIGVPLTAGFFGKFYVFKAALDADLYALTVLGLLNSAVSVYYYLRLLVVMYMHEPTETTADLPPAAPGIQATLWASAVATLVLGMYPSLILDFVTGPAGQLFR